MATAEPAQPINPRTLRGLRQLLAAELRGLVRTCFRAFWMTTLGLAVPCFLYFTAAVLSGFRVAHAGGPIVALLLLLALPFLLMDAIVILLSPLVLWDLALLALLVGGLFVLATTLTLGICLPVLGWSLVKRVRARHQFGAADPRPTHQG